MRKLLNAGFVVLLLLGLMATAALAEENDDEFPPHAHMLVQRPDIEPNFEEDELIGFTVHGFRKCVDMANNRAIPLNAHHERVHFGTAGAMLSEKAGHDVVPTAPLTPWANCAELEDALPIVIVFPPDDDPD